jgi:hypothetical protein
MIKTISSDYINAPEQLQHSNNLVHAEKHFKFWLHVVNVRITSYENNF